MVVSMRESLLSSVLFVKFTRRLCINKPFSPTKISYHRDEEIVYRYPSLNLADVYATIAFYLKHQSEVEVYLQQRQQRSQEIREMNQARFDPQGLRDRLLARLCEQVAS